MIRLRSFANAGVMAVLVAALGACSTPQPEAIEELPPPPPLEEMPVEEEKIEDEPGGIYLASASERLVELYGIEKTIEAEKICLEEGEEAQVTDGRNSLTLSRPHCFEVQTIAKRFKLQEDRARSAQQSEAPRAAMAMKRMARPVIYRVAGGTGKVLEKFPRGTEVKLDTKICLAQDEQISIVGSNGQRVTYRGPGCAQRNARPTRENQGGFTFGWNGLFVSPDRGFAP